ncbi:MAG TPA: polysaccharide biosynthesis tyrosine autokinase [Pyrinomonadaceae bacterium]|nr:polysaccharide biosynthesis tyrosine autokinase [Pyrinomonadaceae bacterium]
MEKDERLLPLPNAGNLQTPKEDYPANYSPFYDDDTIEQKRSIVEYLNIVYKRLPIILAMTVITTVVVAFYMYRQPSIYEAKTEMVIEPRKPKNASKEVNINFGTDANYYNTQLQLLQNPDLMRDVVIRLGLHREPNLFGGQNRSFLSTVQEMVSGEKEAPGGNSSALPVIAQTDGDSVSTDQIILTPEEKARADGYAGILLGGLRIVQTEKTNIVNIFVQSTIPDLAAKVADKTAEMFIEQDIERATQGAKKALTDLDKSTEDLKRTIALQDQERIKYLQNNKLPLGEKGGTFAEQRLTTVSSQLLTAIDDRRNKQAKYDAAVAASRNGQILALVGENKAIQDARSQNLARVADLEKRLEAIDNEIQTAETEKAALLIKYTPAYSDVQKLEARIEALKRNRDKTQVEVSQKIESEGVKLVNNATKETLTGLQAELKSALNRESQLQAAYTSEFATANQQGVAESRLTGLTREIETNRGLLDTYIQRQKELELTVSSSAPDNLTISNNAQTPGGPIGPNRNRNILIAFLLSLSAGIGLAFLLDYLDDSVRTSDDIGRYLGLPTLALIPHQNNGDKRKLAVSPETNGVGSSSMALVSLQDNRSAIAESYRHLRTSLLFSSAGKPPQTILITSSQPSEGKTTTAINTAITLAQSGADVVIIDCDLRRPRLHSHFAMENGHGLTNYLSGEKNTDNLLKQYEHLPKLKVITSGPIPPNPAELLSSNEMKNLLQFLKGNYNHVIIDSPPAISFTDAAILSTLVDGVILVAMAGKSSIHLIRRFKQRLATIGARIYGVVLNGVRLNSVEYNYYGYGYTTSYYNDYDESTPKMEDVLADYETKDNK